jgi:leucyl/phenylalanyl-tRNA--protein transferase
VHGPQHSPIIDPQLLMLAYRSGIFPMSDARDDQEVFWVEPKRRAILPLNGFRCSHSLGRTLRRGIFNVTCNAAFAEVIDACAAPRQGVGGVGSETWISERLAASYCALHAAGRAHSIECWEGGGDGAQRLVGGLYGVGFDRVFCGESMFSRASDASKVALAWLVAALRHCGVILLDCQFLTDHLASLGAVEISQKRYLRLLAAAQTDHWPASTAPPGLAAGSGLATGSGPAAAAGGRPPLALPAGFAGLLDLAKSSGVSSSPGNFIAQSFTQTS